MQLRVVAFQRVLLLCSCYKKKGWLAGGLQEKNVYIFIGKVCSDAAAGGCRLKDLVSLRAVVVQLLY